MGQRELVKIRILSHKDTVESLMSTLQEYGAFHPVPFKEPIEGTSRHRAEKLSSARARRETLSRAMEILEPFRKKGPFFDELLGPKQEVSDDERSRLLKEDRPFESACAVLELSSELSGLDKEHERLLSRAKALKPWMPLNVPASRLRKAKRVRFETGLLPNDAIGPLQSSLAKIGSHWDFHTVSKGKGGEPVPVVFTCLTAEAQQYLPVLNEAGFQEFRLPDEFTPKEEELRLFDKANDIKIEADQCRKRIEAKARDIKAMRLAWDETHAELLRLESEERTLATRSSVVLEGWIPEADYPELKHRIEGLSTAVIEKLKPPPDEAPPVALENNAFATPFEMVTQLYATPRADEPDPTPYLAPFFAIYFGICLTDAGYGLVLLLLSALLIHKMRPEGDGRKLLTVLAICGVSTIFMGMITGGLFGILQSPATRQALPSVESGMKQVMAFDPMADQIFFFQLVLLFGVIQVGFGYVLKFWWNVKSNKLADAIYDQASWLLILGGAFTLALGAMGTLSTGNARLIGGAMMIMGGLLIILFGGRENENIFLRLGAGAYALYGVTGLFGDILSFSRLLALGIATGVIAGVINTIAAMVLEIPNGVGVVLMLLILIIGHLANIAINVMGAFVHTVRLQFVEFFTKFYEGGGEAFKPLAEERHYTILRRRKARP